MRAIAQCHERQKRPLIINRRVSPLLDPKPTLDFRSSVHEPISCLPMLSGSRIAHLA
jgi:hypothetical protein